MMFCAMKLQVKQIRKEKVKERDRHE